MSAVFFQDSIGLVTFDHGFLAAAGAAAADRQGPGHPLPRRIPVPGRGLQDLRQAGDLARPLGGFMRKTVDGAGDLRFPVRQRGRACSRDLSHLNALHDVFLGLVDASFAFELPAVSAGWVEAFDVESGKSRVMSRRELAAMAGRVRDWQDGVARVGQGSGHRRGAARSSIRRSSTLPCSNGWRNGGCGAAESHD